jgi:hypothetical protein
MVPQMVPHCVKKKGRIAQPIDLSGAGKRNRTSDLLITNQLLYRLSYSGEIYEVGKSNQFKFEIQVKVKSIA